MSSISLVGERGPKVAAVIKYGLVAAIGFVVAPIIFQTIAGLVGLAVAVGVGWTMIEAAPLVSLKISNFLMNRFIAEVWKNPVETRQNMRLEYETQLRQEEKDVRALNGEVQIFAGKVGGLIRDYPEEAARFQDQLQNMQDLLEERYAVLRDSSAALSEFNKMTTKISAIWDVAQAGMKAEKLAGSRNQKEALMRIAGDESIKAVDAAMAGSVAALDHLKRMRTDGSVKVERTTTLKLEKTGSAFVLPELKVAQPVFSKSL